MTVKEIVSTWLKEHGYDGLYKQGQEKPVTVHKLMAEKTIDGYVNKVLTMKDGNQKNLYNYLTEVPS